jgi:hypothetical protein
MKFMASPYQIFAQKARERFLEKQKRKASGVGGCIFTLHAQYKMKQYGLSEQRVRNVMRNPKRREEGIVSRTVAVMQPVSPKKIDNNKSARLGKEVWKQEIWVMFQNFAKQKIRIISAWRYPGMSPKRNPIPEEILRELEEGSIIEPYENDSF